MFFVSIHSCFACDVFYYLGWSLFWCCCCGASMWGTNGYAEDLSTARLRAVIGRGRSEGLLRSVEAGLMYI